MTQESRAVLSPAVQFRTPAPCHRSSDPLPAARAAPRRAARLGATRLRRVDLPKIIEDFPWGNLGIFSMGFSMKGKPTVASYGGVPPKNAGEPPSFIDNTSIWFLLEIYSNLNLRCENSTLRWFFGKSYLTIDAFEYHRHVQGQL